MKNTEIKLSLELQILVESIRLVLLNEHSERFLNLINLPEVNWERLRKMVAYHGIRPLFYEACRRVGFVNTLVNELDKFSKKQVLSGLADKVELGNILGILQKNQIEALPYKGLLFSEKLYHNLALRESCDIDIIVREESAKKGLKILQDAGYEIKIDKEPNLDFTNEQLIEILITKTPGREVSLHKKQKINAVRSIDYHWAINEKFREHVIDLEDFFQEANLEEFGKEQILMPNSKGIFKMLINHHGGRDCWIRLKDICDLLAFKSQYKNLDSATLTDWASEIQLKKTFEMGLYLCHYVNMEEKASNQFYYPVSNRIIKFWEESIHISETKQNFKYYFIYRNLQDTTLNLWETLQLMIRVIAFPNLIENKRLIVFPDEYVLLNAFGKVLSFVYYRVLKIKR